MSSGAALFQESAAGEEQPDTAFPAEPGKKHLLALGFSSTFPRAGPPSNNCLYSKLIFVISLKADHFKSASFTLLHLPS